MLTLSSVFFNPFLTILMVLLSNLIELSCIILLSHRCSLKLYRPRSKIVKIEDKGKRDKNMVMSLWSWVIHLGTKDMFFFKENFLLRYSWPYTFSCTFIMSTKECVGICELGKDHSSWLRCNLWAICHTNQLISLTWKIPK